MPQVAQPLSPRNSTCFQQSGQKLCTSATMVPHPAQRGGSAKSSAQRAQVRTTLADHPVLSPDRASHKRRRAETVRHETARRCAATGPRATGPSSSCSSARSPTASNGSTLIEPAVRARAADRLPRSQVADPLGKRREVDVRDPGRCSLKQRVVTSSSRMHGQPPSRAYDLVARHRHARHASTICRSRCA